MTAHETGHVLGLPDHYQGPCSELMSGGGPGPSCTNAYPNSAERARVDQLWANGFAKALDKALQNVRQGAGQGAAERSPRRWTRRCRRLPRADRRRVSFACEVRPVLGPSPLWGRPVPFVPVPVPVRGAGRGGAEAGWVSGCRAG
ncbi:hypothetical protein GCM10009601_16620 [Streptomyces thermospinosisporus]|uniref:Extracellular small neutral protease n=1 Tax=Streptomyces thermospinosisporus TaxID=161482 RepID=A0ABN1YPN0_9ACTN